MIPIIHGSANWKKINRITESVKEHDYLMPDDSVVWESIDPEINICLNSSDQFYLVRRGVLPGISPDLTQAEIDAFILKHLPIATRSEKQTNGQFESVNTTPNGPALRAPKIYELPLSKMVEIDNYLMQTEFPRLAELSLEELAVEFYKQQRILQHLTEENKKKQFTSWSSGIKDQATNWEQKRESKAAKSRAKQEKIASKAAKSEFKPTKQQKFMLQFGMNWNDPAKVAEMLEIHKYGRDVTVALDFDPAKFDYKKCGGE